MGKKKWKKRAKSASAMLNARMGDLLAVGAERDQLRDELESARTELIRARADAEGLREAGRCLYNATQGDIDPTSPVPLLNQVLVLRAGLAHGQEHWLEADPQ